MFDDLFDLIDDWFIQDQESHLQALELNSEDGLKYLNDFQNGFNESLSENYINEYTDNLAVEFDNTSSGVETNILEDFVNFNFSEYYIYEEGWTVSEFEGVGDPVEDAHFWQYQEGSSSCAVVAQMGVYESITGVDLTEAEVCDIAEANGWFHPDRGTYPDDMGKILNHFDIPTDTYYNADLNDIAQALADGNKVIVSLDAREIWEPIRDSDGNPLEQSDAGHAVWVTGIDQLPDGSVKLIINDSGTPDGQMKVVDAVDFVNAWDDFGNQIVIAHDSPPATIV